MVKQNESSDNLSKTVVACISEEPEIWKDIPGYEGFYQASTHGRIKSVERFANHSSGTGTVKRKSIVMKLQVAIHGYIVVGLHAYGKSKTKKVHRLVCLTFHDNPDNKPEVNHKDGIKANCRTDNVEWATSSENGKHAYRTGLKVPPRSMSGILGSDNPLARPVIQFSIDDVFVSEFKCLKDVEDTLHIKHGNVSKVCSGIRKSAGGFIWKYKTAI